MAIACAGAFVVFLDTTIVNIAFPAVFASLASASWRWRWLSRG